MSDELCPSCQAPRGPGEEICWMCQRPWGQEPQDPGAATVVMAPPPPPTVATNWTLVVLLLAMGMILIGAWSGSGIPLTLGALAVIPAMFLSALAALRQPRTQQPRTLVHQIARAVGLMAAILGLMIAAGLAVVLALFVVCVAIIAGSSAIGR